MRKPEIRVQVLPTPGQTLTYGIAVYREYDYRDGSGNRHAEDIPSTWLRHHGKLKADESLGGMTRVEADALAKDLVDRMGVSE